MNIRKHWPWLLAGASGIAILAYAVSADAADLGGTCCADLEQRIAELEATAARKGNRRISVTVSGQVNRAIVFLDTPAGNDAHVIENSADPTRLTISGRAEIRTGWAAGYVLELGFGEDEFGDRNENALGTRLAYGFIETPIGKISLGLANEATDSISQLTTANTLVAAPLLSIKPLTIDDTTEIFDGSRRDLVRYETPSIGGFYVMGAWFSGSDGFDVAARYAGTLGEFNVVAGVGYKKDENPVLFWMPVGAFGFETETYSGSASVKHVGTGIFVSGAYGDLRVSDGTNKIEVKAWHVQGGLERQLFDGAGPTTIFGEYLTGDLDLNSVNLGDGKFFGGGVIQNFGPVDVYATARRSDDLDVTQGLAGLRVKF